MKKKLLQIIREEIENYYSDWSSYDEPRASDRLFGQLTGQVQQPKAPTEEKPTGQFIGYVTKAYTKPLAQPVPVYKNPTSLTGIGTEARGVLTANGDFYLATSYNAMHDNLLEMLAEKGIIPEAKAYHYWERYPEEFVAVQRAFRTNVFSQSTAYDEFPIYYQQMFDEATKAHPFKFVELRGNNDEELDEIESPLDPNFQISMRPEGFVDNNLY